MVIQWYGEGCFKISAGPLTIMTDPNEKESGLAKPKFKADIIVKTKLNPPAPNKGIERDESEETHEILGPGDYEVKGVPITGWALKNSSSNGTLKTVYKLRFDDMSLGFLGEISNFADPSIIEEIGDIDILFVPAGNGGLLETKEAAKIVRQIEPRLLIPTHFKVKDLKRKADGPEAFLKELGMSAQAQDKLTIKRKDLSEKMQVALLKI
ncbi:MAG: MBL fold metallo-hydrolase [bacterium]|nr:MBL fold metallo-hydrolase [bacterium]